MPKKKNCSKPVVLSTVNKKQSLAKVWKSFIFTLIIGLQIALIISYSYSLFRDKITAQQNIRDTLTYQGKIVNSDGVPPPDGLYDASFSIYDAASAGNLLWTEVWDSTDQDPIIDGNQGSQVNVVQGVFTVELNSLCGNWVGSCATGGGVTFDSDNLYLEVALDYDGNGTFEEVFTPRVRFTSTPYSMNADKFDGYDSTDFVLKEGANFSGSISAPGIFDSSLQAVYHFNNDSGGVVKNSALNGVLDGSLINDASLNDNSLFLAGVNQYAVVADNDKLSFGNGTTDVPFTFSAWVYLLKTANFGIISKGTYNSSAEYRLFVNTDGQLNIELYDLTANDTYIGRLSSTAVYPTVDVLGAWAQVAVTYDGSGSSGGLKLYINGQRVDDADDNSGTYTAMHNDSGDLFIGRYESVYSNGRIDDVKIYSRALAPNEIINLFSTERSLNLQVSEISSNKLILRNLDYTWNQSLADESGNIQYDATLNRLVFSPEIYVPDNLPYMADAGNTQDYTHAPDASLILAYDFSGPDGLKDLISDNDAVKSQTASQTLRGYSGYGFQFDANGDELSFTNPDLVDETGSVEIWVNPIVSAGSSDNYILKMAEGNSNQIVLAKIVGVSNELQFAVGNSGLIPATDFNFTDGVWHHLALTWDNGTANLYIDGILNSTQSYGGLSATTFTDFYLGSAGTANTSFNGRVDSFAVYNRVLTSDDILNHYNSAFSSLYADNFKSGSLSASLTSLNAIPAVNNEKSKSDPVYFFQANKVFGLSFAEGAGVVAANVTGTDNAAISGAQWTKNGYFGYGMEFDGLDDSLTVANSNNLNLGNSNFTIEFYLKGDATSSQAGNRIVSKRSGNAGYEVYFDSNDKPTFFIGDGSNTLEVNVSGGFDVADGQFHHVMLVFNRADSVDIYYDSNWVKHSSLAAVTGSLDNTDDLHIGGDATGNYYKGILDSVLIYNTNINLASVIQRSTDGPSQLVVSSEQVNYAPLISLNNDSSNDALISGILNPDNSSGYPLTVWTAASSTPVSDTIYNLINFGEPLSSGFGNLIWDSTNSQFVFDQSLKTAGDFTGNYLKTDNNEFLAFDVVRHTITSDDVTNNYFFEAWAKTTQDKIANMHAILLDVSASSGAVWADDWASGYAVSVVYDGSNIEAMNNNVAWEAGDVCTIFISYEKNNN